MNKIIYIFSMILFVVGILAADSSIVVTIISLLIAFTCMFWLFGCHTVDEIREFTFCNWFQKKYGIDLMSEE